MTDTLQNRLGALVREALAGWRESHSGYNHVDIPNCTECGRIDDMEEEFEPLVAAQPAPAATFSAQARENCLAYHEKLGTVCQTCGPQAPDLEESPQPAPAVMGESDALFKLSREVAANYTKHAGSDDLCELDGEECLADFLHRALAARTAAAESREERPFERVLQLHVDSSESMRETYRRTANSDMENFQEGFTDGVKRAIEVYGNWQAAINGAEWPAAQQPGEFKK